MYLYLILNVGSILVPLIFSFHPKIKFYQLWPAFLPAMGISALIYIIWDVIFTSQGVWGFNEAYFLGIKLMGLPIEEWMFFICIPYASVFTHYTIEKLYPQTTLNATITRIISLILIVVILLLVAINFEKTYTATNGIFAIVILLLVMKYDSNILHNYYTSYIIILVPFIIINGILTGSLIEDQVVWYNDQENLGIRLGTIPIEDTLYAFSLLLLNIFLTEIFRKRLKLVANINNWC